MSRDSDWGPTRRRWRGSRLRYHLLQGLTIEAGMIGGLPTLLL